MMTVDDSTTLWIVKDKLSDGSEVFAVEIEGQKFDCTSEQDARDLADGFVELLEQHTNVTATVMGA